MLLDNDRDRDGSELRPPKKISRPGFTQRRLRILRALEQLKQEIHQEHLDQDKSVHEKEIEEEATQRLASLERGHPKAWTWYQKTSPTSTAPDRRGIHEHIEVAAMRRLDEVKDLEEILRYAKFGRRTDRRLPIAIFERNIFGRGRAEISCYRNDFLGSDALLDWAYGEPIRAGTTGRAISTVYDTMGNMLDRHDPAILVAFNLRAIRRITENHPDVGRYCVIDGTDIEAHLDQHQSVSDTEELLIKHEMEGAAFGYHGGDDRPSKAWRGYTLLIISDIKSTLPLVFMLIPANRPEFKSVIDLLDLLFVHWPDCPIEYLVADREFSREKDLMASLEFRYGIHPVFPLRAGAASGRGVPTKGVPECGDHGPMKYIQADRFFGPGGRAAEGIRQGGLSKSDTDAHIRYECAVHGCWSRPVATYVRDDPRIYTFLPHRGEHQRVGLREALMIRRNAGESVNASLKSRGVGLRGQRHPKWVSTDRQMEWLVGGALLGMTLRRLAYELGVNERVLVDANAKRFLKPGATGYQQ